VVCGKFLLIDTTLTLFYVLLVLLASADPILVSLVHQNKPSAP